MITISFIKSILGDSKDWIRDVRHFKIGLCWILGKLLAVMYIILLPIGIFFRDDYFSIIKRFWNMEFVKYTKG